MNRTPPAPIGISSLGGPSGALFQQSKATPLRKKRAAETIMSY
jgi:hypothetical protein